MKDVLLKAEQIGLGVVCATEVDVTLFTKIDPRLVMKQLDEKFGPLGWKKETTITYSPVMNGTITKMGHCILSVKDKENGEWISRDDYGSPAAWAGDTEDKVISSDCLKRAATNFGIGRELYSFDNIVCKVHDAEGNPLINIEQRTSDGLFVTFDKFRCTQLKYDVDGNIIALAIQDETTGKMVFAENREKPMNEKATILPSEGKAMIDYAAALEMHSNVGAKFMNMPLKSLKADELLWVYSNTQSPQIKKACLCIAEAVEQVKLVFRNGGIAV